MNRRGALRAPVFRAPLHAGKVSTLQIGARAERRAAWFYRLRFFRVVERNWRGGGGEIDLIVRRGALLVFVEVRFRGSGSLAAAHETIDSAKRARIVRAAEHYLLLEAKSNVVVRFDVIVFDATNGWRTMKHYADAFRPAADARRPWLRQT